MKTTTILCMLAMLSMAPVAMAQTKGATTARDTNNETLAHPEDRTPSQTGELTFDELSPQTPSQTGEWAPDELSPQTPSQTGELMRDERDQQTSPKIREWTFDELRSRTPSPTGELTFDELSPQTPSQTGELTFDERHTQRSPRTETNHSLAFNTLGLHYAWELPVARVATVIVRPGVQVGTAWLDGFGPGNDLYYALLPVVDVEPRFYYNLDRRAARGKRTSANQGNFLSLQIKTVLPLGIVSDIHRPRIVGQTILSPMWGMRRVWGRGWLFELSGGVSLNVPWNGDRTLVTPTPNAGVRFGYSF